MATKYIVEGIDRTRMINLAKHIISDEYVNHRFTDAHKQVLKVFVDNWDDLENNTLFKARNVSDFYEEVSDDSTDEIYTAMFWDAGNDEIYYPNGYHNHSCDDCTGPYVIHHVLCRYNKA